MSIQRRSKQQGVVLPNLEPYPRVAALFSEALRHRYAVQHQQAPDLLYCILCDDELEAGDALRKELEGLLATGQRIGLLDREARGRLRSGDIGQFLAACSELEAALFFEDRGFPVLPRPEGKSGRVGDLQIDTSPPVFVEVKAVLDRELEAVEDRVSSKLSRYVPPLLEEVSGQYLVWFTTAGPGTDFSRRPFEGWLRKALAAATVGSSQKTWVYQDKTGLTIEMQVEPVEGSLEHPEMAQMHLPRTLSSDVYLATSTASAYEQLPDDGRCTLVVLRPHLTYPVDADQMLWALYGRPVARIDKKTGEVKWGHSHDGLFYQRLYERLSAVALLSVRRKREGTKEMNLEVFHYDRARHPLDYQKLWGSQIRHLVRKDENSLEWKEWSGEETRATLDE